jgi:hypothetical protein
MIQHNPSNKAAHQQHKKGHDIEQSAEARTPPSYDCQGRLLRREWSAVARIYS